MGLQCLRQGLLLALAFHLHQVLGVLGAGVVDTTLGLLLTLPATGALVLVVSNGLGGVPVTNAFVATVEELVVWDVVLLDVLLNLIEGPVGHGVDLDKAGLVNFDDVEVTTLATLAAATASEDGVNVHFAVGTLGGLNLGNPIVESIVGFPEAVTVLCLEFLGGLSAGRLVHVNVVVGVASADTVDQRQGLAEVVQSIKEDEVNHLGAGHLQLG